MKLKTLREGFLNLIRIKLTPKNQVNMCIFNSTDRGNKYGKWLRKIGSNLKKFMTFCLR